MRTLRISEYLMPSAVILASLMGCGGDLNAPTPSDYGLIEVGHAVNGTITSQDGDCTYSVVDGAWTGLCNGYRIPVRAAGMLSAIVRWGADAPLALFLKTSAGEQIEASCCNSPIVMQVPVDGGVTYRIELAYVGRPVGYPEIPPVAYTLETELLPVPVSSVLVRPVDTLPEGETARLVAVALDANGSALMGRVVAWSSSDPAIVTVSPDGILTAITAGSATLTASVEQQSGTATVTVVVRQPVASVAVEPSRDTLYVDGFDWYQREDMGEVRFRTALLGAVLRDTRGFNVVAGRVVQWGSSDEAVATVSDSGVVTARATGQATITATCEGKLGTALVTVFP